MKLFFVFLVFFIVDLTLSQSNGWSWGERRHRKQLASKKTTQRVSVKECKKFKNLMVEILPFGPHSDDDDDDDDHQFAVRDYNCSLFTGLIVGGQVTDPGEFPHMAGIGWRDSRSTVSFHCGGSLISERFVLSVAHCTDLEGVPPSFVRLGDQNLETIDDAQPADYDIIDIIIHEDYNPFRKEHDIALFKLEKDVIMHPVNPYVRPACLNQLENTFGNVVATGWGKTKTHSETSDELLKVSLSIVDDSTCVSKLGRSIFGKRIFPGQLCAGGERKKDTCQGDSGGPIQVAHKDANCVYDIIGITSYGGVRCGTNAPSIYTRVSHYIDWIEKKVWG